MPGSVIKAAPEQLRHRTAEEQEADRVVLRNLRLVADVLRESGSAKNFEDITEQDWPDGDLGFTGDSAESSQETPPPKVDATPSDSREKNVTQHEDSSEVRHVPPMKMETGPCEPTWENRQTRLAPESSETVEPRSKQSRLGERVYPLLPNLPSQHTGRGNRR